MKRKACSLVFQRVACSDNPRLLLQLHQAPIQEFEGDIIVTSTNRRLEGIHKRNWRGFAGRSSCDASLHELYESSDHDRRFLVRESQKALRKSNHERMLPFAQCLVTDAGPRLKARNVIHMCVPRYPQANNTTTLPHARVETEMEALHLLQACYQNVFDSILQIRSQQQEEETTSLWKSMLAYFPPVASMPKQRQGSKKRSISACLPAIGCGYNGYPTEIAANVALDCIDRIDLTKVNFDVHIEIRFKETKPFDVWQGQVRKRVPTQFEQTILVSS